jgi:hypothetical protein
VDASTRELRTGTVSVRGVTGRSLLLGSLLALINAFWVTMIEVRFYILDGSSLPLFVTPIFLLLVLVGVNRLLGRWRLSQEEMLVGYLMAVISNTFAGHDMLQNFFGQVTHAHYFAVRNHWQEVFVERLPRGFFVTDPAALDAWYQGNVGPARATVYLVHWAVPLALWGTFFLILVANFLCLTLVVRRAWVESERLAFPIIQLPLAMTEPGGALFGSRTMWGGFALAFAISAINGLHVLYPQIPNAPWIKLFDVGQFFTAQPFEAIRTYGMQTSLYPFAIGLAYFIPLDLAFSCWFSYLLARVYFVFGRATGLDGPSAAQGWPFLKEISSGAWIGVAAAIVWANRKHLSASFDAALARGRDASFLDRFAWIGLTISAGLLLAGTHFLLNLSLPVALGFFGILLALSLAITRVRAEFGTPHEIVFVKPADTLVTLFGTRALGETNLIAMQSLYWFNRGYRCHPIPNFLEGFKMAEGRALAVRGLIGVFGLAALVSLLATFAANYFVTYSVGAGSKAVGYKSWVGNEAYTQLASWLSLGQPAGASNVWFFIGGLAVVGGLAWLRTAFVGWPLHPAGFALGVSYAMNYFWLCVFVAWLAKLLLIRYGGMTAHRKAIPFFLGLILGDYTAGALWSLLALLLGQPTYSMYI